MGILQGYPYSIWYQVKPMETQREFQHSGNRLVREPLRNNHGSPLREDSADFRCCRIVSSGTPMPTVGNLRCNFRTSSPSLNLWSESIAEGAAFPVVQCLAQVMPCYPTALSQFPHQLIALVSKNFAVLVPKVRQTIVQALVLIRNRGLLEPIPLFGLFFRLFACEDKTLRKDMFAYVVADVRNQHEKQSNGRRMRQCQHFIFHSSRTIPPRSLAKHLRCRSSSTVARFGLARGQSTRSAGCLHPEPKVSLAARIFPRH